MAVVRAELLVHFDRTIGRRFYRIHRFVYRWTGGLIGHRTPAGPILLLTTVGRKSGHRSTTPLLYMPDGPLFVVVGSNGGRDQPPAWVLNLAATPAAEIQVGRRRLPVEAHIRHAANCAPPGSPSSSRRQRAERRGAVSLGVQTKGEGVLAGAQEAVLGEGFLAD